MIAERTQAINPQVFYLVDAFTNKTFTGNPAGVVPLESWLPDHVMQNMAMEHNQAETAFFVPEADGFRLRWFTPTVEVNFCGHATLASAKVLFDELEYAEPEIKFFTKVGELRVKRVADKLEMDFPAFPPEPVLEIPDFLEQGLGVKPLEVYKNFENYFCILESELAVVSLEPELSTIAKLHPMMVCITAKGESADFVSRYFAPSEGIPEDPVTGSIHATLTPLWAQRLGKTFLQARQVSARGGDLECEMNGDRVLIRGQAVVYLRGEIGLEA
jgi:PhzF family phenazine biosynthesis protein